jgi:integrase
MEEKRKKRARGTGGLIKIKGSPFWYIIYYVDGRKIQESSKTDSAMKAEKLLQIRMGEHSLGISPAQDVKNLKYEDVRNSWFDEHRNQGRFYVTKADGTPTLTGLQHLDTFFKSTPVTRITSDMLRRYIDERRKAGMKDPTIRRNLVMLRSMMNMARKEGKLRQVDIPHFPMPRDSKPRQGFVTPEVFKTLRDALPENLRPLITFIYYTGCRKGAALKITWAMVNKDATEIQLPGDITKSGEPLTLPLVGAGLEDVSVMLRKMFRKEGPVFDATNLRVSWMKTCTKVKLGKMEEDRTYIGLTIHDLRRSAARNLIRAGVSRGVAMQITGHKTEAVFERYNITDAKDIREALVKVGDYVKMGSR